MKIHKEGQNIILTIISIIFLSIFLKSFFVAYAILPLLLFIIYFFRSPKRKIFPIKNTILAPADGRIIILEEVFEKEYFQDKRMQVSIFMSPLNVHVNRNPIEGVVKYFKYHKGKYLVAFHPKASEKNERTTVVVEDKKNRILLFRQIAGFIARRIKYYDHEGKHVHQGTECGFIKFGSRLDLFLPLTTKIKVEIGDKTIAGITHIAEW